MPRVPSGKRFRRTPSLVRGRTDFVWPANGQASDIDGCVFLTTGRLRKAGGVRELVEWDTNPFLTNDVNAMTAFPIPQGPNELVVAHGGSIEYVRRRDTIEIIDGRYDPPEPYLGEYFAQRASWLYASNGRDGNRKWNGSYSAVVGVHDIPSPPSSRTLIHNTNLHEDYSFDNSVTAKTHMMRYRSTFVNSVGAEGAPSAEGEASFIGGSAAPARAVAIITGLQPSNDDSVLFRNMYKRAADGEYYLWRQLSVSETVCYDHEPPLAAATDGQLIVETMSPPPTAKFISFHRGRGYFVPEESHFVYYSDSGIPEQMSSSLQFIEIGTAQEPITAMVQFADSLIVFKANSMWQITTLADGTPVPTALHMSIGCVAPRTAITVYANLIFVGRDGVYSFDGGGVEALTDAQNDDWKLLSRSLLRNAVAWAVEEERNLFIAVPGDSGVGNDVVLEYSYAHREWSKVEGWHITSACTYKGMPLLGVIGDSNDVADIVIWDLSNDSTIPGFTAQGVKSGTSDAGSVQGKVRFGPWSSNESDGAWNRNEEMEVLGVDVLFVYAGSHNLTMRWFEDRDPTATDSTTFQLNQDGTVANITANSDLTSLSGWGEKDWGEGTWSGERELFARVYFPDSVICREIEIEFQNANDDEPFTLSAIVQPIIDKGAERQR